MVQPLNQRTVHTAIKGARQFVQNEKIQIARRTITREQYRGRWPDEYNAFLTSETSRNQYKDPERFFRVMAAKPDLYARKFIFRPVVDSSALIREATTEAFRIIIQQTQRYIAAPNVSGSPNLSTGAYASNFQIMVNGTPARNLSQLDSLSREDTTTIVNTSPYASTVEKNALYFAAVDGVIYYAAQMIARRYPQLGVRFVYQRAHAVPGTHSRYEVPSLTIGTRDRVIDRIRKPGLRHRRRARISRSRA